MAKSRSGQHPRYILYRPTLGSHPIPDSGPPRLPAADWRAIRAWVIYLLPQQPDLSCKPRRNGFLSAFGGCRFSRVFLLFCFRALLVYLPTLPRIPWAAPDSAYVERGVQHEKEPASLWCNSKPTPSHLESRLQFRRCLTGPHRVPTRNILQILHNLKEKRKKKSIIKQEEKKEELPSLRPGGRGVRSAEPSWRRAVAPLDHGSVPQLITTREANNASSSQPG
ncbi:hypothetical protein B0T26DRAFT_26053 [Lasiosphaeria miniovina]|uniref:Uncharacterized protein n=1 Tax=Lasiosphaeria miniovina TaxID=1954250 RepID=A0AA40BG19_9PEZI|nr:uncharacterized protein B0T26DRAFT_26053 [Lasiosphaeria miniovina]KAK0733544.1 hypothetical protein B0T26DRAFT_26053 [Lasiosphaeria miniovina]